MKRPSFGVILFMSVTAIFVLLYSIQFVYAVVTSVTADTSISGGPVWDYWVKYCISRVITYHNITTSATHDTAGNYTFRHKQGPSSNCSTSTWDRNIQHSGNYSVAAYNPYAYTDIIVTEVTPASGQRLGYGYSQNTCESLSDSDWDTLCFSMWYNCP